MRTQTQKIEALLLYFNYGKGKKIMTNTQTVRKQKACHKYTRGKKDEHTGNFKRQIEVNKHINLSLDTRLSCFTRLTLGE